MNLFRVLLEAGLPAPEMDLVTTVGWPDWAGHEQVADVTGGVVALQDVDEAAWFCEPPHWAWTHLQEAFLRVFTAAGRQPYIGRKLSGLLRRAGLENVELAAFPELWRSDDVYRARLITFVEILRESNVASHVLTEGELDALSA